MAKVIPFQAWRYNLSKVQMERVAAPPYDVISPKEQDALYNRDPYNIVKVEFAKVEPNEGQYKSARIDWEGWIGESVIQKDAEKSFYLLSHSFQDPETKKTRSRLVIFGLIKLEPFEAHVVLPHEKTHARAKEDRLKLLQATKTNFSPVFGLYEDKNHLAGSIYKNMSKAKPLFSFSLENGEGHELWQITDPEQIKTLSDMFESKAILIADGHHRYETALNYRNLMREQVLCHSRESGNLDSVDPRLKHSGMTSFFAPDYALMGFVEVEDAGLLILPIHRIIKDLPKFDREAFIKWLRESFSVDKVNESDLHDIARGSRKAIGLQLRNESYVLKLKDPKKAKEKMPAGKPNVWYDLEVSQISHLILNRIGIPEKAMENHVFYTRLSEEAIEKVKSGSANLAFIVPPISAKVMREICLAGELMPQKSTYFYPKLGSGLLMYRHE